MPNPKKIAVITGSRADYGLLRSLLRILKNDPAADLRLVVSAAHLIERFGLSVNEIDRDGFKIDSRVPLPLLEDSTVAVARATGEGLKGFADALSALSPEIVVLIGDRYEMLAAGTAALLLNIPAAHIHGGEITFGAFDDAIRHALTKLSLLHFTAAEAYRKRVIQLGEDPARVFCVGTPGNDQIAEVMQLSRAETAKRLGIDENAKYLVITYHPSTAQPETDLPAIEALLNALDDYPQYTLVFTGVNADPGHRMIDQKIRNFVSKAPTRAKLFSSLGSEGYINAIRNAATVVGNSSSGIVEAPAMGVPTVNIGNRQAGRLRAASILDCPPDRNAICAAIEQATSPTFLEKARGIDPPYGRGGASARIAKILLDTDIRSLLPKKFYDL
jgi:UDP-hydrolysing UDP-N-acetyl-D-glucosamine 2-epimerase